MEFDYSKLASRIRELRLVKGDKQSVLEKKAGLVFGSISKIELGKREVSVADLVKISKALEINVNYLLDEEEISGQDSFALELKALKALKLLPQEQYKQILKMIEGQVYFLAKDAKPGLKQKLDELVSDLSHLSGNI